MSSRNDRFECRWRGSRILLTAYLGCLSLALVSTLLLAIPAWAKALGVALCLLHGARYLRRSILLDAPDAPTALRRDSGGWQLWSRRHGWQPVQLRPDSVALPFLVLLRYRPATGHWLERRWVRTVCIAADAMAPDDHRRLRLRLKFSRRRWAVPE
ncbi:protein YgfX [Pseudomonas sp. NPDC090201]|uniref:protein YgfX n=1 Tax=Pseudomonas sp. NPDC090201 TaxID=3364475 RepID=UPI0037FD31E7